MLDFPPTIPVKDIALEASEHKQFAKGWQTCADLYQGGTVLQDKVQLQSLYLLPKPKEPSEVYRTRQQRFNYTNLLGNILGWYGAALFKEAPQIVKKDANAAPPPVAADGTAPKEPEIKQDAQDFCAAFEKDADRAGTTFVDFWRKVFESLALNKSAYVLIDLPSLDPDDPKPASLDQQQKAGLLTPHLVLYTPSQVINWETDSYGNLEWCVIAVANEEREAFKAARIVDYWYYFDRRQVACYSAIRKDGGQQADADAATLVEGYPRAHAMTDLNRIPVRKIEVLDGLWLANRVFLQLLNHLNLDNAYDWSLYNSALAQLVITGQYNDSTMRSEVSYINLPEGGKIEYLEPAGRAYTAINDRLQALEERIYKACYLMDQARTNKATAAAQSGLSKQQDKTPSRDALSGFGDVIRPAMQAIYADVLAIRGFAEIEPDVRGFDFEDKAGVEELDFMVTAYSLDIQSDTYRRERDKKAARKVLPDANPETFALVDQEIDDNPTPEQAAVVALEKQQATQAASFTQDFKGAGGIGA